jgi:Type ISP C-terminal specificity domain
LVENPSPLAGEERDLARSELSRSGEGASAGAGNTGAQTRAVPSPQPSPARGEGVIGRVHINPDQYFEGVPQIAWDIHIGGYQPAQKWLKDRKGRALSFDDVIHYQRIIKILCETDRIMKEIALPL